MPKLKKPFFSLTARGKLGKWLRVFPVHGEHIVKTSADPPDIKSLAQLSWRHMYQKAVALWHGLSPAEKVSWESAGTEKHMTGFAWFMSQCLKPNPGLYLPLQGGTMTGEIIMSDEAISELPDPVNPQDADTLAAREAAITAALEDCIDSHIHGWDGTAWQKLKTESATQHNLRVVLYTGPNKIGSEDLANILIGDSGWAPYFQSFLRLSDSDTDAWFEWRTARSASDANSGATIASVALFGFNGATFDRLRTYPAGILKVGRAEVGLQTPRLVGTGQIKASAGKLYWLEVNPGAGNSLLELTDDLDGAGAVVYDCFHTSRESHMHSFDPPMEFTTGIYLKTFTSMTSVIAGYL